MAEAQMPAVFGVPGSSSSEEFPAGSFGCIDPGDLGLKLTKSAYERSRQKLTKYQCLQFLKDRCSNNGLQCHGYTPHTESCFFLAIAGQMIPCGLPPQNAFDLRINLVSHMQMEPIKRIPGGVVDLRTYVHGSWSEYLDLMKLPDTFADEVAVVAMAHYLKKDILVVPSIKLSPLYDAFMVCGPQGQCSEPMLMVGHVYDKYFQRVKQREETAPPTAASPPRTQDATWAINPMLDLTPISPNYSAAHDNHSRLANHPAVLSGKIKREEIPKDVVPGGKYPFWQVELYHNRADTRGFDPDRSFEEPDIPFQFQGDRDARVLNIERKILLAKENVKSKTQLVVERSRKAKAKDDIYVLQEDIKVLEDYIAGLEDEAMDILTDNNYDSIAPQRMNEIENVVENQQRKLVLVRSPVVQSGTLSGALREHANNTVTDGRALSEQVQCPVFYSKHEWITCGILDFITQIEIMRDIIGANCSARSCSEFQRISGHLNRAESMLDDDTIFPLLQIEAYPDSITRDVKIVFTDLCHVFIHFYEQHLPNIGPNQVDVTRIGLHFYAFAKTFYLVNDQLLDELMEAFIREYHFT